MPTQSQVSSVPSSIPEFDENDYYFTVCGAEVHYRGMAIACGVFGFTSVCIVFAITVWKFSWTRYEDSLDALAMTGFFVFFVSGTFVHFFVLISAKKNDVGFSDINLVTNIVGF